MDKTIHVANPVHTYDQVVTYIDKYDAIAVVAKPDYPAPPKTARDLVAAIKSARL